MKNESTDDEVKFDRALYLEHRKSLVELGVAQIGLFDKTLLLLSTGAIGASALFVDTFIAKDEPIHLQSLLALSWGAFAFTMLANLLSYLSSWHDMEKERIDWDAQYQSGEIGVPSVNRWRTVTQWLNTGAFLSFLVGLATLLIFCLNNIGFTK